MLWYLCRISQLSIALASYTAKSIRIAVNVHSGPTPRGRVVSSFAAATTEQAAMPASTSEPWWKIMVHWAVQCCVYCLCGELVCSGLASCSLEISHPSRFTWRGALPYLRRYMTLFYPDSHIQHG